MSGSVPGSGGLGFVSRCSRRLLSAVGEAALLRPSLAVAQQMLARRSIKLNVKTIRRLCRMQYSAFQQANLPCGSDFLESTIRRMIKVLLVLARPTAIRALGDHAY